MKKLEYNIFWAISLRGLTLAQAGYADPKTVNPLLWDDVITFRMSIKMSEGNWGFQEQPLVYQVMGNGKNVQARMVSKADWKSLYSIYRKYIRPMYS